MPRPADGIAWREAAAILGVSDNTVARLVRAGASPRSGRRWRGLSREQIERLALNRHWPGQMSDYWVSPAEAAGMILGVTLGRVRQLADAGRIPYEVTPSGHRLYRREQLEVVAKREDRPAVGGLDSQ